ncbi:conserved membrane protein of unknown function [Thauera humireducens]|uniref:hypothetical protein n=1 Tax=Thauera humireducens TaxID=1134435 RepID=UPI002467A4B6|nr:hypothetical protein [Thauera humireducens]CAH1747470.1 conserved membrane protein of unknown function [Thauera humireducens]
MSPRAVSFLLVLVATPIVLAGYFLGKSVPFAEQWPLFEALRTTASIIFAVVGAWLAIIYPERLRLSFRGEAGGNGQAVKMGQLLHPAMHSTAILCVVLFVGIAAPLLKQLPELLAHRAVLRGLSYGLLVSLTLWQIWTVVLTLIPADVVKSVSDREAKRAQFVDGFKSLSQK